MFRIGDKIKLKHDTESAPATITECKCITNSDNTVSIIYKVFYGFTFIDGVNYECFDWYSKPYLIEA